MSWQSCESAAAWRLDHEAIADGQIEGRDPGQGVRRAAGSFDPSRRRRATSAVVKSSGAVGSMLAEQRPAKRPEGGHLTHDAVAAAVSAGAA